MSNVDTYLRSINKIKANDKLNTDENIENTLSNTTDVQKSKNPFVRALGAVYDVTSNITTGAIKGVEGIIDTGASIVGNIGGLVSNNFEDKVGNFVKTNYTQKLSNKWENFFGTDELKASSYSNDLPDVAESIFDGVTTSIGEMMPSIIIGNVAGGLGASAKAVKVASLGSFGASAMGNSTEEGLEQGNSLGVSTAYGALEGAKEVGTELIGDKLFGSKLFGVIGSDVGNIGKQTLGTVVKELAKQGFGEGMEEVIGDVFDPIIKKATINRNEKFSDLAKESYNPKNLATDFITGALTGVIMDGMGEIANAKTYGLEHSNINNIIEGAYETTQEAIKLEKQGKLNATEKAKIQAKLAQYEQAYEQALKDTKNTIHEDNVKSHSDYMNEVKNFNAQEEVIKDTISKSNKNLNVIFENNENIEKALKNNGIKTTINGIEGFTDGKGNFVVSRENATNKYSTSIHEAFHNVSEESKNSIIKEITSKDFSFTKTINGVETEINNNNWLDTYKKLQPNLTEAQYQEELASDYIGNMSTDYKSFSKLLGKNSVVSRLVERVFGKDNNLITKVRESLKNAQNGEFEGVRYSNNSYVDTTIDSIPKPKDTDSANSIKNYADLSQDRVYTVAQVKSFFDNVVKDIQTKLDSTAIASELGEEATKIKFEGGKEKYINELFRQMNNKSENTRLDVAKKLVDTFGENVKINDKSLIDVMNASDSKSFEKFTHSLVNSLNAQYENGKASRMIKSKNFIEKLQAKIIQQAKLLNSQQVFFTQVRKYNKQIDTLKENLKRTYPQSTKETVFFEEMKAPLKALSKLSINSTGYCGKNFKEQFESLKTSISENKNIDVEIKESLLNELNVIDPTIAKLSSVELKSLVNVFKALNHLNATFDTAFINNKRVVASETANTIVNETKTTPEKNIVIRKVGDFGRSLLSPQARLQLMENKAGGFLSTEVINDLRLGEKKVYENKFYLVEEYNDYLNKNKGILKSLKKHNLTIDNYSISDSQAVSLYMAYKNAEGRNHIEKNGIVVETKKGTHHINVSAEAIAEVNAYVESNYADYLTELKKVWWEKSGKLYSDTIEARLGYKVDNRKNYFHLSVDSSNFTDVIGDTESMYKYMSNAFNPSFSKKISNKSSSSLFIGDITTETAQFTNQLAVFSGMSPTVQNLNKVFNSKVKWEGQDVTLINYLSKTNDEGFKTYFRNLLLNMQGMKGSNQAKGNKFLAGVRGSMARYALGANVKVMLSQTTSYAMAFSELRATSLAKGLTMRFSSKDCDRLMEHNSYFKNRFMNGEATRAITLESNNVSSTIEKAGGLFSKGIGFMDKKTIGKIFNACIAEVAKNKGVSVKEVKSNEAYYQEAVDLAEDVTRKTQPNYSPLDNGSITQDRGDIAKSFLMYSSVTRNFLSNVVMSSYQSTHGGAKTKVLKSVAGLITAQTLLALLSQLTKKFLGKNDDDKIFDSDFFIEALENSTINLIPVAKDIYGMFKSGYEIDFNTLDIFNDVANTLMDYDKLTGTNAERLQYIYQMFKVTGQLTGIPMKNIVEYTTSLFANFDVDRAIKVRNVLYNVDNSKIKEDITSNYLKGNYSLATTNLESYLDKCELKYPAKATSKEIARLYSLGYTNILPNQNIETLIIDGVSYKLKPNARSKFTSIYSKASEEVDNFVSSRQFKKLNDEQKAKYIKKIYQTYYNIAKYEVVSKDYELSKFEQALTSFNASDLAIIISQTDSLKSNVFKSKKEQCLSIISNLSNDKQNIILNILGYSI